MTPERNNYESKHIENKINDSAWMVECSMTRDILRFQ